MRTRRGASLLAMVLVFSAAASVVVLGYHTLWRGSSRTLFSVEERRQLVNLGRSALAEAYYEMQHSLDESRVGWQDWFTSAAVPADRTLPPKETRANAAVMSLDAAALEYSATDVSVNRVQRLEVTNSDAPPGILDMRVRVTVRRRFPLHEATLQMVERRTFRFEPASGPFAFAGRTVVLSPTPVATLLEDAP